MARQADDVSHPAFAKLFVETEFAAAEGAILATRRQRSSGDPKVWAAHLAVVEGESSGDVQFETDRARFSSAIVARMTSFDPSVEQSSAITISKFGQS